MHKRTLQIIGLIDVVVVCGGIALTAIFNHMSFLSAATAVVAIVTFFGILSESDNVENEKLFRKTITISVVTVYLVTVSTVVFFKGEWKSPDVTQTLLASFTSVVGVVIAFYFGSSAYIEAKEKSKKQSDSKISNEDST